jgi:2-oxoglutarate ferredoxin oxidoreductase subunit beta
LKRAAAHKGSVFVEIFQNCHIFNDGAFEDFASRPVRADKTIQLEHGQPMFFGKERDYGLTFKGVTPAIVEIGKDGATADDVLVHDETRRDATLAYLLTQLRFPEMPVPLGVFRAVERPTYETMLEQQVEDEMAKDGAGDLEALLSAGDTWVVE